MDTSQGQGADYVGLTPCKAVPFHVLRFLDLWSYSFMVVLGVQHFPGKDVETLLVSHGLRVEEGL